MVNCVVAMNKSKRIYHFQGCISQTYSHKAFGLIVLFVRQLDDYFSNKTVACVLLLSHNFLKNTDIDLVQNENTVTIRNHVIALII